MAFSELSLALLGGVPAQEVKDRDKITEEINLKCFMKGFLVLKSLEGLFY
jgi:hypothetical protein